VPYIALASASAGFDELVFQRAQPGFEPRLPDEENNQTDDDEY
jgi:hypothetical protein